MDLERGIVEALFYDYPWEGVVKLIEKKTDCKKFLDSIPELMKWRMPHFDGKELQQFVSEFERECKEQYVGFDWKFWPLLYISKVGGSLLALEHQRPVVLFEQVLRWRSLSLDVGEDLLSLSWLAMKEKGGGSVRTDFAWEDTLLVDEKSRNRVLGQKPLTDLHAHIGHSSDAFNIRWIYWMNNCWDKPKMKDNRKLLCVAAVIRYYVFQIVTDGGCPNKQDRKDILDARVGGEMLQTLHDCIYKKVDTASDNSMVPNIDGIEHWDYAIRQGWNVGKDVLKSPYMLLAGERWMIYTFLQRLYEGKQDAEDFALLFYLYLLIKVDWRKRFIPTNGLIGLSNYQEYEKADNDDALHGFREPKRRYAVQTSLGPRRNNYLEARVSLGYEPKDKKTAEEKPTDDDEMIEEPLVNINLEVPLFGEGKRNKEPLLRQMRLVVTNSKKQYVQKPRLEYYQEKKEEFDRIIARYKRNKRLKKKDFSVVGIDFSSSDEYARPEVYAQLVRYARKKGFNRFTYHAGEDFYDLMDGLRTIEDILVYLKWDKHCRFGHAIALGIDAKEYYGGRGRNVIATRQVLLDNLIWFLMKQQELGFPLAKKVKSEIEGEARLLYDKIGYSQPFVLDKYQKSMRLRGDHPLKGIRVEGMHLFNECANDNDRTLEALRSDSCVKTLFDEYYEENELSKKGCEVIHWKMPRGVEDGITAIQNQLITQIKQKGIAIETCPTSNYMIGPFDRYDELPVNKFLDSMPDNPISINTDDKGVMATSIEGEYTLMAASMAKRKVPEADIRAKLDRVVKDAKASRFKI